MAAVTICSDFGAQNDKVWHCFHCFPIYFPWSDDSQGYQLLKIYLNARSVNINQKIKNWKWAIKSPNTPIVLVTQVCATLLWPHGLQPTRLLCPWDFPGKHPGVCCPFLFQGIFLTQGSNPHLLHWQVDSLPLSHQGSSLLGVAKDNWLRGPLKTQCGYEKWNQQVEFQSPRWPFSS